MKMNDKKMMRGMSMLMVLLALIMVTSGVQAQEVDNDYTKESYKMIGAGLALGLAGIGTGLSQGPIGAAAVGMIAEDEKKFTYGLIFTALPETIVLFGFLAIFLL